MRNAGVNPVWNLNQGAFPTYSGLLPITETSDLRTHVTGRFNSAVSDEVGEFKTALTHSFMDGPLSRLKFGASASKRTKINRDWRIPPDLGCAYCGYVSRVPTELVRIFNAGNVAGAGGPTQWLTYDPDAYYAWLETEAAWGQAAPGGILYNPNDPDRAQNIVNGLNRYGGFNPVDWPLAWWRGQEKNYAAYAQANFESDWGAMPWQLDIGVRYIRTDITSDAVSAQVERIIGNPGDPTNAQVVFTEPVPLSKKSSYNDWLPSFNFRMNLRDDLVLRASASKTLPRPTLTNLRANVFSFDVTPHLLWFGLQWALVIGFIGGLFPAWHAARMPITNALRAL